jgi:hypothetical protein
MANSWIDSIIKRVWPWFLEYIWPIIREYVRELVESLLRDLQERIRSWFAARSQLREEHATRQASDAEGCAGQATNVSDRERFEAIAKVWREVAEMFREENERLQSKVDELVRDAGAQAARQMADAEPTLNAQKGSLRLMIAGTVADLPQPSERAD